MPGKIFIGAVALTAAYILSPFLAAVGMGAIFAVLFYPWMKRIERGRFPSSLAAGLFTLAVTLLIFLPLGALTVAGVRSGLTELRQIKQLNPTSVGPGSSDQALDKLFESSGLDALLERTARLLPIDATQVTDQLKELIASVANHLGDVLSGFIAHVPNMAVAFVIFLLSLFFFLADGLKLLEIVREHSFFPAPETERLFKAFSGLCRGVILASMISGGSQALLATCACLLLGVSQALTVGVVVFVASFVPVVGAFPVLVSMSAYQLLSGRIFAGVMLGAATIVIATVDNLIRPLVLRGGSNLHPLVGFVSALGGLEVFGVTGIFIGPVICGTAIALLQRQPARTGGSYDTEVGLHSQLPGP
ncbi:MAG: AI-2E family transporter [Deltaproteobacteria bacterium]|nr:AI-2E family transporter [Deltaproteobacteria bacterium]